MVLSISFALSGHRSMELGDFMSSFQEKTVVGGDQSAGPAMIGRMVGKALHACMHERGGGQLVKLVTLSRRQIKEHNQAPFPWHFP